MTLLVQQKALQAACGPRPLLLSIRKKDRQLFDQVRRAMHSVVLNLAEAEGNDPGTARARFASACGSAKEVRAGLGWEAQPGTRKQECGRAARSMVVPVFRGEGNARCAVWDGKHSEWGEPSFGSVQSRWGDRVPLASTPVPDGVARTIDDERESPHWLAAATAIATTQRQCYTS